MNMDYSIRDILLHSFNFIKRKRYKVIVLLLFYISLNFVAYYGFIKRLDKILPLLDSRVMETGRFSQIDFLKLFVTSEIVIYGLIILLIMTFISALITTIHFDFTYEKDNDILTQIKYTFKNYHYYIFSGLILVIIFILSFMLYFVFIFIPLLNVIAIILLFIWSIYLITFYRFIIYTSFIERSYDYMFSTTKQLMTGHIGGSILLLILSGIPNGIVEKMNNEVVVEQLVNGHFNFTHIAILILIRYTIKFFFEIADMSYISIGFKVHRKNQEFSSETGFTSVITTEKKEKDPNQIFFD